MKDFLEGVGVSLLVVVLTLTGMFGVASCLHWMTTEGPNLGYHSGVPTYYEKGRRDFHRKVDIGDCPFKVTNRECDWRDGWKDEHDRLATMTSPDCSLQPLPTPETTR